MPLLDFITQLFVSGELVFREPPSAEVGDRAQLVRLLADQYDDHCLEVAGPSLPFQEETALAASHFVERACWFLVERSDTDECVEQNLRLPAPQSPAEHLSADLLLRFLPLLHRRARAISPDDVLCVRLEQTLRAWPLSGVLADVPEGPLTPPDFDGHAGLLLLYAERLAEHEKREWLPGGGPAYETVQWVYHQLGKDVPPLPTPVAEKEDGDRD